MRKDSKVITLIAVVIVVLAIAFLAYTMFGNRKSADMSDNTQKSTLGTSKNDPLNVSAEDLTLAGESFAKKYAGKYIDFDGLLQGTSSVAGSPSAHATLVYGDDINAGSLSDGSLFWITATKSTFSDDLMNFATDNNSPYESKNYPKVHIVAKVSKFNDNYNAIQLEPIVNNDGKSPSIVSR